MHYKRFYYRNASVFELPGSKTARQKGDMNESQLLALHDLQPVEQRMKVKVTSTP